MVDLDKLGVGSELIFGADTRRQRARVRRVKYTFVMSRERQPGSEAIVTRRVHRVTIDLIPTKG